MLKNKRGFTLVELIVVITILAILGTIAFISLQGYSKSARDSVRIGDMGKIKTSLELFYLGAGKYPITTSGFQISYSGSEVWTQGTFGDSTFANVSKLDIIPKDPLTNREYTYSITKTKQEYQIAGMMESDGIANKLHKSETYAGDTLATAVVSGNYNGQMIKTQTGTNCSILSLPSIVSAYANSETDLMNIVNSEGLVYNGYNNLPTNYITSKYKSDGGFKFIPNKFVVYNDSESCAPLYKSNDDTARSALIEGLRESYLGTIIENNGGISDITNIDLSDNSKKNLISSTLVNNSLGGKLEVSNSNNNLSESGYIYECDGLIGEVNIPGDEEEEFGFGGDEGGLGGEEGGTPNFNLCDNTIIVEPGQDFPISSNITGVKGGRDVFAFVLEEGIKIGIVSKDGDDIGYATPFGGDDIGYATTFLYDKDGNFISMNDEVDSSEELIYTPSYSGYYFLGVMGYRDDGMWNDYKIEVNTIYNCDENPGYSNALYKPGVPTYYNQVWQKTNSSGPCYYECRNGYSGDDCGNPRSTPLNSITECITPREIGYTTIDGTDSLLTCNDDIIVCSGLGVGHYIASCNAGATQVYTNQTFPSTTSSRTSGIKAWAGGLYLWGNSTDISNSPISSTKVSGVTDDSTYYNDLFIDTLYGRVRWMEEPVNKNAWGQVTGTHEAMIGPCRDGYHVPTSTEWGVIKNIIRDYGWSSLGDYNYIESWKKIKLPLAGKRNAGGYMTDQGTEGLYRYNYLSNYGSSWFQIEDYDTGGNSSNGIQEGKSVRCIKNY